MLNIDEAIQHCMDVVQLNEAYCDAADSDSDRVKCAADHRQLAKWLMELKDARGALNDCEVEINELLGELQEAKRLLRLALEDINDNNICNESRICNVCVSANHGTCPDTFKWRYTDEAKKLLGEKL